MDRFWNKVDRRDPGECWPWKAATNGRGYGSIKLGGRTVSAHRLAFSLHHGQEAEHNVLHSCDVKACCNPAHLYDGTDRQNVHDAVDRGQHPRGSRHGRAKLTEEQVHAIRDEHEAGASYCALGRKYGVADAVARKACLGITWRHI